MELHSLVDFHEMERLVPEWQELHDAASHRSFYNEPAFCLSWIKHFGANPPTPGRMAADSRAPARHTRPMLVVVRNHGRLVAVLPLRAVPSEIGRIAGNLRPGRLRKTPVLQIESLINGHTDDCNFLVRAGCEPVAARALKRALGSQSWQGANLGFFPSDSPIARVMRSVPFSLVAGRQTRSQQFLRFSDTYDAYLDGHPATRKKLSRAMRQLERDFGPVSLDLWTGWDAIAAGFPVFVEVDAKSWKATSGEGESLESSPVARGFYEELTARFARMDRAQVWALRLGGITAASVLSYESHGVIYQYKTSYKEAFATRGKHQPGLTLEALIIGHAWPGFSGMDFMSDLRQAWWECETYRLESEKRLALDPRRWLSR